MIKWILLFLALTGIVTSVRGQTPEGENQLYFEVLPKSTIGFAGSSNINTFFCNTASVSGEGNGLWNSDSAAPVSCSAEVILTAASLDCGSGRMNRDLYKALDVEENPLIDYRLQEIVSFRELEADHRFEVGTNGLMSVAGATVQVEITFIIVAIGGNRYSIRGSKELSMRDFDIDPPKALFGLIRAKEQLRVEFDIIARTAEKN